MYIYIYSLTLIFMHIHMASEHIHKYIHTYIHTIHTHTLINIHTQHIHTYINHQNIHMYIYIHIYIQKRRQNISNFISQYCGKTVCKVNSLRDYVSVLDISASSSKNLLLARIAAYET